MLTLLWQILSVVLVFGLVVFVHELGHFLAAKAMGVYAPRFSIGFGPALWRRQWGETEYVIAAIPLGGYVRMASREDETMQAIEGGGEQHIEVPPHRWFESKSLPARLFILVAGVSMNMLLGFVVLLGLRLGYGEPLLQTRVVGAVRPVAEAPALAGLAPGDTIVAVGGERIGSWNEFLRTTVEGEGDTLRLLTSRGALVVPLATPEARRRIVAAVDPFAPPVVGQVEPGSPAERGGLEVGDSIVAIGRAPIAGWPDLLREIRASPGRPLPFEVVREGVRRTVTVRPDTSEQPDPVTGEPQVIGRVGIGPLYEQGFERQSAGEAVRGAWRDTWWMAGLIVDVVGKLVVGEANPRTLGGPIAIARESAAAAKAGLDQLLFLVALLSINVAVLNLLPIPILDGGQILMNVAEAVKGGAFSARTREYLMRFGLLVIALLIVFVLFNDLRNLFRL